MAQPTDNSFLILDKHHRCLVTKGEDALWRLVQLERAPGERFLPIIEHWYQSLFHEALPSPCGQCGDGEKMTFTFMLRSEPDISHDEQFRFVRLWDLAEHLPHEEQDNLWRIYDATMLNGFTPPSRQFDVFSFADSVESAAQLAHMVCLGKKRATAFWITETERDKEQFFPFVGALSLVTDGFGYPRCFITTRATTILPFHDVPPYFAALEGEGDRSFADWRDGHRDYFEREARRFSLCFSDSSKVFLEEFDVIKTF